MDNMVNRMREHNPQETRIHYVISSGGKASNVVPDFSEVYYYSPLSKSEQAQSIFKRVVNAANGAALGIDTKVDYKIFNWHTRFAHQQIIGNCYAVKFRITGGVT